MMVSYGLQVGKMVAGMLCTHYVYMVFCRHRDDRSGFSAALTIFQHHKEISCHLHVGQASNRCLLCEAEAFAGNVPVSTPSLWCADGFKPSQWVLGNEAPSSLADH